MTADWPTLSTWWARRRTCPTTRRPAWSRRACSATTVRACERSCPARRAALPGHVSGQGGKPGRRGAARARRLSPGVRDWPPGRAVPTARAPAFARAHLAGRGRAYGHAGRARPDHVPAALPEVPARLPGLATAGVPRVLRGSLRATAAAHGRRGVLQPAPVPCPCAQPHPTHHTDGPL